MPKNLSGQKPSGTKSPSPSSGSGQYPGANPMKLAGNVPTSKPPKAK